MSNKRVHDLNRRTMAGPLTTFFAGLALAAAVLPQAAHADASPPPAACQALQAKYPQFKGKTLVNAVNPHTPGYESLDPNDPSKYIGFDIDLGETIGACLGFSVTYRPVAFASLMTTLASGQADIVISDIYATEERAKAGDFITYSKVFRWRAGGQGQSEEDHWHQYRRCAARPRPRTPAMSRCRSLQNLAADCKKEGTAAPELQLYDNNANCIQAILAGRADTYVNDVNTVDQAVKAYPDKLEKATAVTLPYSVGIAVPREKPEFRDAVHRGPCRDSEGRHREPRFWKKVVA